MKGSTVVIGATGNIGGEVMKQLSAKGIPATAAVRNLEKAAYLKTSIVELVRFDYSEPETFQTAFQGAVSIFLINPVGDSAIEGNAKLVVDAAQTAGIKKIVFITCMGADMDENNSLRKAEKVIEDAGFKYTFLRPNWFFQNFNNMYLSTIRKQAGIFVPAADASVSFIDARDIAAVAIKALTEDEHDSKAYTLTGGKAYNYYEVVEAISKVAGKEIMYYPISEDEARVSMKLAEYPDNSIESILFLYNKIRHGLNAPVVDNAAKILSREPYSLEQYVGDYKSAWM